MGATAESNSGVSIRDNPVETRQRMTNKAKRQNEPPMTLDPNRLWTFDEARYYLRVGESTLRAYLKSGKLPAVRVGGSKGRLLLFKKADLDALLVPVGVNDVDEREEDKETED